MLTTHSQNIGSLAAYPFAPYLSDGIGRKLTIFIGATIMLAAVAVQSAAHNLNMFIAARYVSALIVRQTSSNVVSISFLIGFGLTFAANAAPMLVTELAYPKYRAQLTALYNSLWYSGNIVYVPRRLLHFSVFMPCQFRSASWASFGTARINSDWSWRIPSLLQGIPSILQVFLIWFTPESPRWLISKGRNEEALKTLAYYHADGNEEDALVKYEYEEIKAAIEFDREGE